jgi:hypothetical protein
MWENKKDPALLAMFPVNRIRKAAETGGKAGAVSVGEQEKKPVPNPATSQPR